MINMVKDCIIRLATTRKESRKDNDSSIQSENVKVWMSAVKVQSTLGNRIACDVHVRAWKDLVYTMGFKHIDITYLGCRLN